MVLGRAQQAAGEQLLASRVSQSLPSCFQPGSQSALNTFLTSQKMARNAKCAFVAMALGRARQVAGETLTGMSGLPELAPLLSA